MSNDKKTLADVKPGGRVRLGDALLPCPFCGSPARRIDFGVGSGENEGGSCIECTGCQSSGPVEFGYKENFISNWNRRALSAQPSQPSSLDLKAMLAACVPGGDMADPQVIADNIRHWFAAQPSPGGQGDARAIIEEFIQCATLGRPHGKLIAQAKDYLAARQPGGQDARAQFEEYRGGDCERDAQGYYVNARTAQDWAMWQAALAARQPVRSIPEWFELVIRDVCELEPEDPDAADTVCIRLRDLRLIMERHGLPAQAVDLEQFRPAVCAMGLYAEEPEDVDEAKRLLALIDGKAVGK